MTTTFRGYRTRTDAIVEVNEDGKHFSELNWYLNEVNHSPTGFEWGYYGSGPSQLSYAMLRYLFGKMYNAPEKAREMAEEYYQSFKQTVIASLINTPKWQLTENEIVGWLTARMAFPDKQATIVKSPLTNGNIGVTINID